MQSGSQGSQLSRAEVPLLKGGQGGCPGTGTGVEERRANSIMLVGPQGSGTGGAGQSSTDGMLDHSTVNAQDGSKSGFA